MTPDALAALPSAFAEDVLGLSLYGWQANVLDSLLPLKSATALKTCNGAGKTTRVIAPLALWHCAAFARSTTYITSGSWQQIKNQLMPALKAHACKMPGWTFNETQIVSPTGSFISAFSSTDPNKVEGKHEDSDDPISGPCLIIVDEAKGVTRDIFQAIDRCSWTRLLYASSPGAKVGEFYDAFHRNHSMFRRFSAGRNECPKADHQRFNRTIAKWGEEHPFTRSTVYAEFMSDDGMSSYSIGMDDVERNLLSPPVYDRGNGSRVFWCDFAAGGDENVLGMREGNRVTIIRAWREKDTFKSAAEFVTLFRDLKAKPDEVYGDGSGLGIAAFNDMAGMGFIVPASHRIFNNSAAIDGTTYADRGAELWFEGGLAIRSLKYILPENDEELKIQLSTRKVRPHSRGLLDLETKQDMRKRGLASPDRAETVTALMTLQGPVVDTYRDQQTARQSRESMGVSQMNDLRW